MKTIKAITILALTLMTSTQAMASTCDLTIVPEILERTSPRVERTFKGRRDWTGMSPGIIALNIALPVSLFFTTAGCIDNANPSPYCHIGVNSENWYANQYRKLNTKCENYIRSHYASDILFDDGDQLIAEHYYCGEPYKHNVTSRRIRPAVDLMYGDPVYAEMTIEQAVAQKCQKLTQCIIRANDASELEQLQQTQIQLGCQ